MLIGDKVRITECVGTKLSYYEGTLIHLPVETGDWIYIRKENGMELGFNPNSANVMDMFKIGETNG